MHPRAGTAVGHCQDVSNLPLCGVLDRNLASLARSAASTGSPSRRHRAGCWRFWATQPVECFKLADGAGTHTCNEERSAGGAISWDLGVQLASRRRRLPSLGARADDWGLVGEQGRGPLVGAGDPCHSLALHVPAAHSHSFTRPPASVLELQHTTCAGRHQHTGTAGGGYVLTLRSEAQSSVRAGGLGSHVSAPPWQLVPAAAHLCCAWLRAFSQR